MVNLGQLFGELKTCLKKDQFIFKKRLHGVKKITDENKQDSALKKIAADISRSQTLRNTRLTNLPQVTYPQQLPVSQKKQVIKDAIANNQVVIIAGETGSGKTTQIPKMCLELGRGVDGFAPLYTLVFHL